MNTIPKLVKFLNKKCLKLIDAQFYRSYTLISCKNNEFSIKEVCLLEITKTYYLFLSDSSEYIQMMEGSYKNSWWILS